MAQSHPPPLKQGLDLTRFDESMNPAACRAWLAVELNREPEAYDLYHAGKLLYQTGRWLAAAKLLQIYTEEPGNELPGKHLLGYAYFMCEERRHAIHQLRQVVNCGFDADWQLLVEMQVDVDREDGLLPPPDESLQAPV